MRQERDYAHRSLLDKLGLYPESRVALVGVHDPDFAAALSGVVVRPPSRRLAGAYDIVFLKLEAPGDLPRIATAAKHITPDGAVWVFHPKGRGAAPTDAEVRAAGIAAGLVDNKISAYSDTHTATRYVIPVARRATLRDGDRDGAARLRARR